MKKNTAALAAALLLLVLESPAQNTASTFPPIAGWKLTVEETVYTPNNLWDVIDGAADLFLEYNFVDLRIARYQRSSDIEIKVELYRHKTAVDAFGMYSQERYPDYHFINLGTQGYTEKGTLNFLCGEYYAKISTVQSAQEAQVGLMAIGKTLARGLNRPSSWPDLLAAFPQKGKQANTEQFISKNFLGYSFFNNVYTASYIEDVPFKAFIIRMGSAEEARKTAETYFASLPKDGVSKSQGSRYLVRDPHTGLIEFVLGSNSIYGVIGAGDKGSDALLVEMGRGLGELH
ncbi:MAG: hypothetical protein NTU47_17375 [Ignavibacteriales bacterium]|nr:hypothetical protein [Ignavibacteriales bacterium]